MKADATMEELQSATAACLEWAARVCEKKMPNPVCNWSDAQIVEALRLTAEIIRSGKVESMNTDAARLNWLRDRMFTHRWNGVVGNGWSTDWSVAPDFRHTQQLLRDTTSGCAAGDFRVAIDVAMRAQSGR